MKAVVVERGEEEGFWRVSKWAVCRSPRRLPETMEKEIGGTKGAHSFLKKGYNVVTELEAG